MLTTDSKKTILVLGKSGQLGRTWADMSDHYGMFSFTFVGREEIDLEQPQEILNFFKKQTFDIIVNCAAYTAVDKAEEEPLLAEQINHHAVSLLAQIAKEKGSTLVHISTDYVFDGKANLPYRENDQTNPVNVYGLSKVQGEKALQTINPDSLIIRTSWVYSNYGNNFVKTIRRKAKECKRLDIVADQIGSPTYTGDIVEAVMVVLQQRQALPNDQKKGCDIYHYSSEGLCSWYDLAKTIAEYSGLDCDIKPISSKEYKTKAVRPQYTVLNHDKIKRNFSVVIPHWKDSLARYCDQVVQ